MQRPMQRPMQQDIADWLTQWAALNLDHTARVEEKGDLAPAAKRCVAEAADAGYDVPAIKAAAGGDLEQYFMNAVNAGHIAD